MRKICKECKKTIEVENSEDMKKFFYYKKTRTGDYFLNTCIECELEKRTARYAKEREL